MLKVDDLKVGEEVSPQEIIDILRKCYLTKHALQRMEERGEWVVRGEDGRINFKELFIRLKETIKNSLICYVNIDDKGNKSINVCIDEYNYFVFAPKEDGQWCMITFKEPSHNKINVFEKQKMARDGVVYYYHDKH